MMNKLVLLKLPTKMFLHNNNVEKYVIIACFWMIGHINHFISIIHCFSTKHWTIRTARNSSQRRTLLRTIVSIASLDVSLLSKEWFITSLAISISWLLTHLGIVRLALSSTINNAFYFSKAIRRCIKMFTTYRTISVKCSVDHKTLPCDNRYDDIIPHRIQLA